MSQRASVEATFEWRDSYSEYALSQIKHHVEGRYTYFGKDVRTYPDTDKKFISVSGRMRDFTDFCSPGLLAWFVDLCTNVLVAPDIAGLTIDIDFGPRYRYTWVDGNLTKLKGILDL
jgi:hypothetical protein